VEEEIKGTKGNKSVMCPSPDASLHRCGKTHPVSVFKVCTTLHVALPLVAPDAIGRICAWVGWLEAAFGARIKFRAPGSSVPLLLCHHHLMEKI